MLVPVTVTDHNGRTVEGLRAPQSAVIHSDGMDNTSRNSKGELMRAALEADVQVYTIIVGNFRAQNDVEAKQATIKAGRALRNRT